MTTVNVIIPLYNRAEHISLLLHNLANIYKQDPSFCVWIADFQSIDINLKEFIKQFQYRIELVKLPPPFRLAFGLQSSADKVVNGNEILFFCDADAVLPITIFERIRNNTTKGKTFYCPIVSYEKPDRTVWVPTKDHKGTGHIGVYKSDFSKSGGWSGTRHMKNKFWGGHDGHLFRTLKKRLKPVRKIENDHYTRSHVRTNGWYRTRLSRHGKKIVAEWEI